MADEATSKAIEVSSSPERTPTPAQQRANAHAGSTDTDQLVSDIEKTREELAVTIDAIVDRVSPKKVVERSKQQAREGVADATVIVKQHASTAAEVVREKAIVAGGVLKDRTSTATEAVKGAAASVREKVSGPSDAGPVRSPLSPATSVAIGSATPVTGSGTSAASTSDGRAPSDGPVSSASPSPLPPNTQSIDVGELPPPESVDTTGSLADRADAAGTTVEPAGSELPAPRPVGTASPVPPVPPVYAGAGVAALVAAVLLLLRRRRRSRRALRRR